MGRYYLLHLAIFNRKAHRLHPSLVKGFKTFIGQMLDHESKKEEIGNMVVGNLKKFLEEQ
jgi:hypothetical protein